MEEEGKSEGDRFSNFFLHLGIELLVFALPHLRHDKKVLYEALEAVKPEVGLLIRISLFNRNADDVHQCLHESLLDGLG